MSKSNQHGEVKEGLIKYERINWVRSKKRNRRLDRWRRLELGSSPCKEESVAGTTEGLSLEARWVKEEAVAGTTGKRRRCCRWDRHEKNKEEFRLGADDNKNVDRIDGCRWRGQHRLWRIALTREEDEDLVYEQATTTKRNVDRIDELTNAPCVGKAYRVGLQAATNREFPVCRDGSVCRISRRVSPCKEEVVCQLWITNRGRSVSPWWWEKKEFVSNESPWVGRRVSPPINPLKEKEWDP